MANNLLGYDLAKITSHKSTMCHIEQKNGRLPSKVTLSTLWKKITVTVGITETLSSLFHRDQALLDEIFLHRWRNP